MTNPTNPMLEKAARAAWEQCCLLESDECRQIALAVLRAIREPDEGMIEAGDVSMQARGCMGGSRDVWEDMLDHITGDNS